AVPGASSSCFARARNLRSSGRGTEGGRGPARGCCIAWRGGRCPARSSPLLAPQSHGFLAGTVGEGEQHRLILCFQLKRRPRRHYESVARLELVFLAADGHIARPVADRIAVSVGRA